MPAPDEPLSADRELAAALARGGAAVAQAGAELTGAVRDLVTEQGQLREQVAQSHDASARAASYSATTSARVDTAKQELGECVAQLAGQVDALTAEVRHLRRVREAYSAAAIVALVLVLIGALGAGLYAACEPHSAARMIQGDGLAGGKDRPRRREPQPPPPRRGGPDLGTDPTDRTVDPDEVPSESDKVGCEQQGGLPNWQRSPGCRHPEAIPTPEY